MAQNITIELTDAQWALVVEHGGEAFQIPDTLEDDVYTPVTMTAAIVSGELKTFLTNRITRRIQDKATKAQQAAFEV
jgi:hypothetical protein|tara:strand:- start:116 stop:346 length:231 start_codon:yes stop_codon:yes gene_type:complete